MHETGRHGWFEAVVTGGSPVDGGRAPVVRRRSRSAVTVNLLVGAALLGVTWAALRPLGVTDPAVVVAVAAVTYLVVRRLPRRWAHGPHRCGVTALRDARYAEAIEHFRRSADLLSRHPWADRWRVLALGDESAVPYREMALVNIAFCHLRLGDHARAVAVYEHALRAFPDSDLARDGLASLRIAPDGTARDGTARDAGRPGPNIR